MKQITALLLGAGQRGADIYADYALRFPSELKIVGVAEPRADRLSAFASRHSLPPEQCFADWRDALAQPRFADCAFVCTQDRMHCEPVLQALAKGYHVLCEKPMSPDKAELLQMRDAAQTSDKLLSICHVLRYAPFFVKIKELLDAGAIGQLISMQHIESVGYWHAAHSFVRGNWRRADETSPMILAKCCHDMDILRWLAGGRCQSVQSFGSLAHFKAENAPAGAPEFCLDGCAHRDACPYYAPRFYLEHPHAKGDGFAAVVSLDQSPEALLRALESGPYGRCVYRCDNTVVDNQIVNLLFENGVTVSMEMCAFTQKCERAINIMGSKGQLRGNMEENSLTLFDFSTGNQTQFKLHLPPGGGHSGSDTSMMKDFCAQVSAALANAQSNVPGANGSAAPSATGAVQTKSSAEQSVESHLMALAAEESRLQGGCAIIVN